MLQHQQSNGETVTFEYVIKKTNTWLGVYEVYNPGANPTNFFLNL